jgi:hypothetical protein
MSSVFLENLLDIQQRSQFNHNFFFYFSDLCKSFINLTMWLKSVFILYVFKIFLSYLSI